MLRLTYGAMDWEQFARRRVLCGRSSLRFACQVAGIRSQPAQDSERDPRPWRSGGCESHARCRRCPPPGAHSNTADLPRQTSLEPIWVHMSRWTFQVWARLLQSFRSRCGPFRLLRQCLLFRHVSRRRALLPVNAGILRGHRRMLPRRADLLPHVRLYQAGSVLHGRRMSGPGVYGSRLHRRPYVQLCGRLQVWNGLLL